MAHKRVGVVSENAPWHPGCRTIQSRKVIVKRGQVSIQAEADGMKKRLSKTGSILWHGCRIGGFIDGGESVGMGGEMTIEQQSERQRCSM